ncbi:HNH endonuclease [Serratia rhizosphaerae]
MHAANKENQRSILTIKITMLSSREAVLQAMQESDQIGRDKFLKIYGFKPSRKYHLQHNGKRYDSKAIVAVACGYEFGQPLKSKDFSGGAKTVVPVLQKLGFEVLETPHPFGYLVSGTLYQRKALRDLYGGQYQGGIWTPKDFPVIFIFTGESGQEYGYQDGWTKDGSFIYTGEGQKGDMAFTRGNKAILEHKEKGKDIFLFEDKAKENGVRYAGMFECDTWEYIDCPDVDGNQRKGIRFNLFPVHSQQEIDIEDSHFSSTPSQEKENIAQLRGKALKASMTTSTHQHSDNKRSWYKRSEDVKRYVLKRAAGICESCEQPAPFKKKNGTPYLEPHHTKRLADEGPDHPKWVGAICPTCHRRIHSGEDGEEVNKKLMQKIAIKEKTWE